MLCPWCGGHKCIWFFAASSRKQQVRPALQTVDFTRPRWSENNTRISRFFGPLPSLTPSFLDMCIGSWRLLQRHLSTAAVPTLAAPQISIYVATTNQQNARVVLWTDLMQIFVGKCKYKNVLSRVFMQGPVRPTPSPPHPCDGHLEITMAPHIPTKHVTTIPESTSHSACGTTLCRFAWCHASFRSEGIKYSRAPDPTGAVAGSLFPTHAYKDFPWTSHNWHWS